MTSPSPDALRKIAEAENPIDLAAEEIAHLSRMPESDMDRGEWCRLRVAKALLAATRSIAELRREVEILEHAMWEIAHFDGYDGSLCADPEDCPNCTAQAAVANLAAARQALAEEERP